MLRIAICDDEPLHLKYTAKAVQKRVMDLDAEITTYGEGEKLLLAVEEGGYIPDIAILDIRMEEVDGILLAERLNQLCPQCGVIFLTGYPCYASDVYETEHAYFIVKQDLEKYLGPAIEKVLRTREKQAVTIRYGGTAAVVNLEDIFFAERVGHRTVVMTRSGEYMTKQSPAELFDPYLEHFIHCHQSYWVRCGAIAVLGKNEFHLKNGDQIPISRTYRQSAKDAFLQAMARQTGA